MIRLRALYADRFKQLSDVRLHFPEKGSFLVEGANESGKSTLFEAVFFGIFGRGLATETGLNDLIAYGAEDAVVRILIETQNRVLDINRVIRRDAPNRWALKLYSRDGEELITGNAAVNSRIVEELGLDADSLLNSCFVEQKKLDKLESLSAADRERALMRLLNLDKLLSIERELVPTAAERIEAQIQSQRASLAELRSEIQRLQQEIARTERRVSAAKIAALMNELDAKTAKRLELEAALSDAESRLSEVVAKLARASELTEALAVLDKAAIQARDAERLCTQLYELENQLTTLTAVKDQDVPRLQQRINGLDRLCRHLQRLEALQALVSEWQSRLSELESRITAADELMRTAETRKANLESLSAEVQDSSLQLNRAKFRLAEADRRVEELKRLADRLDRIERFRRLTEDKAKQFQTATELESEARRSREEVVKLRQKLSGINAMRGTLRALLRAEEIFAAWTSWRDALKLKQHLAELNAKSSENTAKCEQAAAKAREEANKSARTQTAAFLALLAAVSLGTAAGCLSQVWEHWNILAGAAGAAAAIFAGFAAKAANHRRKSRAFNQEWEACAQAALEATKQHDALLHSYRLRYHGDAESPAEPGFIEKVRLLELEQTPSEDPDTIERMLASARSALDARRKACEALNGGLLSMSAGDALKVLDGRAEALAEELARAEAAAASAERAAEEATRNLGSLGTKPLELWLEKRRRILTARAEAAALKAREIGLADALPPSEVDGAWLQGILQKVRQALQMADEERNDAVEAVVDAERKLAAESARRDSVQKELEQILHQLEELHREDAEAEATGLKRKLGKAEAILAFWRSRLEAAAHQLQVALSIPEATGELRRTEAELRQAQQRVASLGELQAESERLRSDLEAAQTECRGLIQQAVLLCAAGIGDTKGLSDVHSLQNAVEKLRGAALQELDSLGKEKLQELKDALQRKHGEISAKLAAQQSEIELVERDIASLLEPLGINPPHPMCRTSLQNVFPELKDAAETSPEGLAEELENLKAALLSAKERAAELEERLHLEGVELDAEEEIRKRDTALRSLIVREKAVQIARTARESAVRKVLPNTMRNMQRILPLLTMGRYHDAEIGEDYRIRVWDERAGDWKTKGVFSGGARDQFSLALRLAFALATLPQERGTAPSFIFLDEPFSSFDAERAAALTSLLTQGDIASAFDQVFVITHNAEPIRSAFHYHLRLFNGRVEHDMESVPLPLDFYSREVGSMGGGKEA
jgi:DNA repair exonuclease SbcCD ATPase subunit